MILPYIKRAKIYDWEYSKLRVHWNISIFKFPIFQTFLFSVKISKYNSLKFQRIYIGLPNIPQIYLCIKSSGTKVPLDITYLILYK